MATMIKVMKEKESDDKAKSLTPEYVQGKLFSLYNIAHKFHLDTKSFAAHKALGELYEGLQTFKDDISEIMMGYMGGKRIGKITLDEIPAYSDEAAMKLSKDVTEFAYELKEWAESKEFCDIENIADSLSGLGAKTTYLLTLT